MLNRFKEDIAAFRAHDPAATSTVSIVLNSPGMRAIWAYRRQHWLWEHGHPLLARTLSTWSRHRFGVEIHPAAQIGRRFVIDHGHGIVIGETCIIGDDCMVYQGVTLGGTGKETGKRHPTLEDNVTVGVGAAVLGDITLGEGSKVGGGAVVVKDVPPQCTVVGIPGHIATRCGVRVRRDRGADAGSAPVFSPAKGEAPGPQAGRSGASGAPGSAPTQGSTPPAPHHRRQRMPDPVQQTMDILEARIAQLEAEVARLQSRPAAPGVSSGTPDTATAPEVAEGACAPTAAASQPLAEGPGSFSAPDAAAPHDPDAAPEPPQAPDATASHAPTATEE